jgi:hypothetical protein
MCDRLALQDQGGYQVIQFGQFPGLKVDTFTGLLSVGNICPMSRSGPIVEFLKGTASFPVAGVADIGRFRRNRAGELRMFFA